jgi:hypothetical protein
MLAQNYNAHFPSSLAKLINDTAFDLSPSPKQPCPHISQKGADKIFPK